MVKRPFARETHIYVSRQTTDISLDVYTSKQSKMPNPILLWFHGGYLITGSRIAIPAWLLNYAYDQGWTVVSPDYRVLPESTGLATIEDLQSAYQWVAKELPCLHRDCDTSRIILAGASAGGWCAVVNAMLVTDPASCAGLPLPRALFLVYPIVDIGSEKWAKSFTIPDSHVDSETKHHLLQDIPLRIARREASLGEDFPTSEEELKTRKRLPLLYSVMEEGRLLDYLTGLAGFAARRMTSGLESSVLRGLPMQKLFPLSCEFSSEYPPTIIVHGTADRGVSSEESEILFQKLQASGLAVQYFPEPGADHAFDIGWEEPNDTMKSALRALQGISPDHFLCPAKLDHPAAVAAVQRRTHLYHLMRFLGAPLAQPSSSSLNLRWIDSTDLLDITAPPPASPPQTRQTLPAKTARTWMDMDDDAAAMAAAMGFSSFGAQNLPSKKRKYNPNNDAVVSIDGAQRHGTGANSAPLAERRAPPTNADEIALDDEDDDGANDGSDATAANTAGSLSTQANSGILHGIGAGIAGLPQRPAPPQGGFPGHHQRRGGGPRHGSSGHHGINKLWYEDYYDHFSNENPWAKLEEAAGLKPISTWVPVHVNRDEPHQAQAA